MPRPRTVYRGKRKYSWIITLAAMLVVVLILLSVWLFYYLQRFIVYDKDGLHLDLSVKREDTLRPDVSAQPLPAATAPPVDVEIVVEHKDYSDVQTSAGTDVAPIRAIYVPATELRESTLTYYTGSMGDFNALVLELKRADGFLYWHSSVPTADSFAVNGTLEIAPHIAALKEQGVYLIAQIGGLLDDTMALRNAPVALKNADGSVYADRDGHSYLDPYSDATRTYLLALMTELRGMGFDEVLFTGLACPEAEGLRFSVAMTQAPDAVTAVSSLSLWLREQADALGLKLSVTLPGESLRGSTVAGQDPALLLRIYDRLVADTDYDHLAADLAFAASALGGDDPSRILAITDNFAPERDCYIVK